MQKQLLYFVCCFLLSYNRVFNVNTVFAYEQVNSNSDNRAIELILSSSMAGVLNSAQEE
jgi:hypothetical protein